ncbi:AAA family ATPase [Bowmanella denitrificans]|uniref:AAA family ATPase n=1 Tax=Bowmanella denitrificans TaxID=366582 RepID=UPI000C9A852A|nr:AAA family ATPase [Bowmanella denitrificans]
MLEVLQAAALRPEDFNESVDFILPGFLAKRQITMLFADGGNGKTWVGFALANYCAAQRLTVVYMDFDNPLSVLAERGVERKLVRRYANLHYIQRSKSALGAGELLEQLANAATASRYENMVFIFDSLRNFGDVAHDSQIMRVMDRLMNIREAGATVVVLHHSNKDGRNYQGSNNIRNSVDNMYRLRKREQANGIGVLLEAVKERANIQNKAFDICPTSLALTEKDMTEALASEDDLEFIQDVKAALRQFPTLNKTDLLKAVGCEKDDKTARARLDRYEGKHWSCSRKGRSCHYSYLAEQPTQP